MNNEMLGRKFIGLGFEGGEINAGDKVEVVYLPENVRVLGDYEIGDVFTTKLSNTFANGVYRVGRRYSIPSNWCKLVSRANKTVGTQWIASRWGMKEEVE